LLKGTNSLSTLIIPEQLNRLPELARDLWWTWNPQAREVFRKLDYQIWRQTAHNPVLMLQAVPQETLNHAANNERYLAIYDTAVDALEAARSARGTWWQYHYPDTPGPIAYSISRFPSTPAALASSPAITAKKPAISAFR
jgi:starch phosphorylase